MAIKVPHEALVEVRVSPSYSVVFTGLDKTSDLVRELLPRATRGIVVSDENTHPLYGAKVRDQMLAAGFDCLAIVLPPGETTKDLHHLESIYDQALNWKIDRATVVLAVGGGVVGDIAGFAAATLLRGLPLVHIPTTLIAQVDSSIGGKTGINHHVGKNLIGSFHQPVAVLVDTRALKSLPEREWRSGLAEVIKHALIDDVDLFDFLQSNWDLIAKRDPETISHLLPRAARVKARVVAEDEFEKGRRAILNFGHTFGHAVEKVAGYGRFTHGEAVALGMRAALHLSREVNPDLDFERADGLVGRISVPEGLGEVDVDSLIESMHMDKKARDGQIRYVLLRQIGEAYVSSDVPREYVEAAWGYLRRVAG